MVKSVSFGNAQSQDAQDYAIQQAQALAQALRAQSMQPIESAAPNAPISWTQGLAKMLESYRAGQEGRKVEGLLNQRDQQAQSAIADKLNALLPQQGTEVGGIDASSPPFELSTPLVQSNAIPGAPNQSQLSPNAKLLGTALAGGNPEQANSWLGQQIASRVLQPPKPLMDVAAGGAVYDPNTGKPVFTNPKEGTGTRTDIKTRSVGNGYLQDYWIDPITHQEAKQGEPYKENPSKAQAFGLMAAGQLTGGALQNAAEKYRQTGNLPNLGMGSVALKVKIINKAAELSALEGDDASAASYRQQANKAGQMAFGQLQRQKAITGAFEKTAIANLDLALARSAEVARSGSPLFNRGIIAFKKGVEGDPATAAFVNSLVAARNEYAKVLSSSTGAQGITDSARREAEDLFSKTDTPEMLAATIALAKQEMGNRMAGFDKQAAELNPLLTARDAPSGTPQPAAGPVTISNDAEYNALPSGAEYIAPDGSHRKKP